MRPRPSGAGGPDLGGGEPGRIEDRDGPGAEGERLAELHQRGVLALAGPWDDDSGALLIFRLDEAGVRAEIGTDPYYTAPGVRVVGVRGWAPVVGS